MTTFDELRAQDTVLGSLIYADHIQIMLMVALIVDALRIGKVSATRADEMLDNALKLYTLETMTARMN